ncbi:unnamed protein product [Urochloa humidicola]
MALPVATAPLVFLLLLVAAAGSGAGGSGDDDAEWSFSFSTMIGCASPPPEASEPEASASFRASLATLLAALPSAAAATGFASASVGAGRGRVRALGLCFGPAAPAESGCVECLQGAVAAVGACAGDDVRSAGAWRPGCAVVYAADDDSASSPADEDGDTEQSRSRSSPAGDAHSYPDGLEQRLADLAEAVAQHNRRPLWKMALSVLFYVLAAIGAVAILVLLCAFLAGCCLAESLFRNGGAAGLQRGNAAAGAEQGEGIDVYVAATNGPVPTWPVAMQLRFH